MRSHNIIYPDRFLSNAAHHLFDDHKQIYRPCLSPKGTIIWRLLPADNGDRDAIIILVQLAIKLRYTEKV